ncbi:MAG: hypothetical protein HY005_01350 [Candidatus Staskawiczbacteria bacterium]|nr:hypothetical protein [Candidatus Staskawiczbacteria bacterium]MBI3337253.1 hypothetical protein [Candidatus Staskawiczbacteria bacterium]
MKVIFYGGRQAGLINLLATMALGHNVVCVVPVDDIVEQVALKMGLNVRKPKNINLDDFVNYLETLEADLFLCCHGRQIIKSRILKEFKCINFHPCLYKYKGADPIKKLLDEGNKKASVAAHWMAEDIDEGEVIVENFKEIVSQNEIGVYNELYPLYVQTLVDVFEKIKKI